MSRFILPLQTAINSNGDPLNGAKLYFYETLTNTLKDTYSESTLTTPNANPVIADAYGVFDEIYLNGTYRVELKNSLGVIQPNYPVDNITGVLGDSVLNIAALKLVTGSANQSISILGYYTANDGGRGDFYWSAASTATDNGGTIIKATATATGRWLRIYNGDIYAAWFGIPNSDDATTDRISELSAAMTVANTDGVRVRTDKNTFALSDLELPSNNNIELVGPSGAHQYTTIQHLNTTGKMIGLETSIVETVHNIIFKNIYFKAHASAATGAKGVYIKLPIAGASGFGLKTYNCWFEGWPVGYECEDAFESGHYETAFNNCDVGHYGFAGISNVYFNNNIRTINANGIGIWILGQNNLVLTNDTATSSGNAGTTMFRIGNDTAATGTDITAAQITGNALLSNVHLEGMAIGVDVRSASTVTADNPHIVANNLANVIAFQFVFLTKSSSIIRPAYSTANSGTFQYHVDVTAKTKGLAAVIYRRLQITDIPLLSGITYADGFLDEYETYTKIVLAANWTTFTTGAGQTLPFDTISVSTKNDHDLTANGVECQVDGFYDVSAMAKVSGHTITTEYIIEIQAAGTTIASKTIQATSTGSMSLDISTTIAATDGQDITIKLTQDSGVNVTVATGTGNSFLTVTKSNN